MLQLIAEFRDDPRHRKLDLGVGMYRDERGRTPVMKAVKLAEQHLVDTQSSKSYLGIEGDPQFVAALEPVLLGTDHGLGGRLVAIQTPGGSAALRLGADLIRMATPTAHTWIGRPTWPNHEPIMDSAGLTLREYPFFDRRAQRVDLDSTLSALGEASAGDVVLLHGCCHNPTGADFTAEQWREVADLMARRRLVPFIDIAYQGLGDGLDRDAEGVRIVLETVEEALVAYSCDKNFGLYRERVGALFVLGRDGTEAAVAQANLSSLVRVNWSMPPDHGAAIVRAILESAHLSELWRAELDEMQGRISRNRAAIASEDPRLDFVTRQRGMFSTLDISAQQALALRETHGIYVTAAGRVNFAGMRASDAPVIAQALRAVGSLSVAG